MKLLKLLRAAINKFLSWIAPYEGQPWKHLPQKDNADIRFERSLRNAMTRSKQKPHYLMDKGRSI